MDSNQLADMLENINKEAYTVDSITVVRNGAMILDVYFHGLTKDSLHLIHSCTKSVMSILIGIAIDHGYIKDIHQPVIGFFPEKRFDNLDKRKKAMTLEHLLMMTTGLKCRDSWRYGRRGLFELLKQEDWVQYILNLPMEEYPGAHFNYCNSASFLLSAIVQNTTGMKTIEFARKHLFKPLGITDLDWGTNPNGITIGWAELELKPRDMAKIGYFCLKQGLWEGQQIVSRDWMEASTQRHIGINWQLFQGYGYQWWVHSSGYYSALGSGGQFIYVIPNKNLVVVFTSYFMTGDVYVPDKLLDVYIIPAIKSDKALPSDPEAKHRLNTLINKYATGQ